MPAVWLAAPACAALMADMGADMVQVEPPGGDAWRGFRMKSLGFPESFPTNYAFQIDNRGKSQHRPRPGRARSERGGPAPHRDCRCVRNQPGARPPRALRPHLPAACGPQPAPRLPRVQRLRPRRPGRDRLGFDSTLEHPDLGPFDTLDTPVKFSRSAVGARTPTPEVGQHTEEVLLEAGYTWEEIGALRERRVFG